MAILGLYWDNGKRQWKVLWAAADHVGLIKVWVWTWGLGSKLSSRLFV